MRPAIIVEVNSNCNGRDDITEISKRFILKKFVLHCVVNTLRLSIILRVSGLGHADAYAVFPQSIYIYSASILTAPV